MSSPLSPLLLCGCCCFLLSVACGRCCGLRQLALATAHFGSEQESAQHQHSTTHTMKQFTPEQKHEILLEYQSHSTTHSFPALAARHAVPGGARTIQRWHARWDHTIASLQRKPVPGRPHVLTPTEVQRHIAAPIRRLNRSARRVRYSKVAQQLRARTGKSVSDRTVQRIGKDELAAKKTRGKKRTAEESQCTDTRGRVNALILGERHTDFNVAVLLLILSVATDV